MKRFNKNEQIVFKEQTGGKLKDFYYNIGKMFQFYDLRKQYFYWYKYSDQNNG